MKHCIDMKIIIEKLDKNMNKCVYGKRSEYKYTITTKWNILLRYFIKEIRYERNM